MKNSGLAVVGAVMACMGLGMMIVAAFRMVGVDLGNLFGSSELESESWIGPNLPTLGIALLLLVLGFFLMSSFKKTSGGS